MNKILTAFMLIVAAVLGFCAGVTVYALAAHLVVNLSGEGAAGGYLMIYAILLFPLIGVPLGIFFACTAMAFIKSKIDAKKNPKEQRFSWIVFAVILVVLGGLMVASRAFLMNWI